MRPYGEITGKTLPRTTPRGFHVAPRYRRDIRKAERAAAWQKPRKAERRRASKRSRAT